MIPKINEPTKLSDFRPISLCNVLYKVISKILVSRLKSVLPTLVTEEHAAFIPERYINDNGIIAHEMLHSLQVKKYCAESFMAVKTDISKAYDRVEWRFLEEVIRQHEFSSHWIS